VPSRAQLDGP